MCICMYIYVYVYIHLYDLVNYGLVGLDFFCLDRIEFFERKKRLVRRLDMFFVESTRPARY